MFLIFSLKHRLWVLVRTASLRRFLRVPTIYVLSKNKKNVQFFYLNFFFFTAVKNRCILYGHFFVMYTVKEAPSNFTDRSNAALLL